MGSFAGVALIDTVYIGERTQAKLNWQVTVNYYFIFVNENIMWFD